MSFNVARPKAAGGPVGGWGEAGQDTEMVLMGRGEAVLTRHQQGFVNQALANTFGIIYLLVILVVAVTAIPLMILTNQGQG